MHERRLDDAASTGRDLAIVVVGTLLFALASVHFELSERIASWTESRERYQLDELPGVLLFLALGLAWFAWRRVAESSAELRRRTRMQAELVDALADNRRLENESRRVQDEDRRHLAREMHDGLGQYLNAVKVDATCLRNGLAPSQFDLHENAVAIIRSVDHLQGAVRDILQRLRPPGLDELGVAAAIEGCVDDWRQRLPSTRFDLDIDDDCAGLGETVDMTLYRLAQEGLTNVARHSRARHVTIRVERTSAGAAGESTLTFEMRDDGVGGLSANGITGLGLIGMRERVESLHGTFEAGDVTPHGFRIVATVPLAVEGREA